MFSPMTRLIYDYIILFYILCNKNNITILDYVLNYLYENILFYDLLSFNKEYCDFGKSW